jgi:hypothetical protein
MSGNYVDPSTYSNAGAFKDVGVSAANLQTGASCWLNTLTFDASKSNPIYGNSTTVQPDALTTRYIIKAFDGQTADSALINITQYANELAQKQDKATVRNDAGGIIAASFGTNTGYLKYGTTNGVNPIIQWGVATLVPGSHMSVATFPISSTSATSYGIVGITSTTVGNANFSKVSSFVADYQRTASSCDFRTSEDQDVVYIAIGY